jgi:hypothetical protein
VYGQRLAFYRQILGAIKPRTDRRMSGAGLNCGTGRQLPLADCVAAPYARAADEPVRRRLPFSLKMNYVKHAETEIIPTLISGLTLLQRPDHHPIPILIGRGRSEKIERRKTCGRQSYRI